MTKSKPALSVHPFAVYVLRNYIALVVSIRIIATHVRIRINALSTKSHASASITAAKVPVKGPRIVSVPSIQIPSYFDMWF